MAALILAAFAAAAADPVLPPKVVSPVEITAQPRVSPPVDAKVLVGGDEDSPASKQVILWPAWAYQVGASGDVTLNCWVNVAGLAEHCRVVFEKPAGKGFGNAALALRPNIKVAPHLGPNGPEAANMNIGLTFRAPDTEIDSRMQASMDARAANVEVTHNPAPIHRVTQMNNPVWAKAPDFERTAAAYPAAGGGVEGYAVAHCSVSMKGMLSGCKVASETPGGHGFGAAALGLAPLFQVPAEIMARAPRGEPIAVDVPIRFVAPVAGAARTVTAPSWLKGFDPEAAPKLFPPEAAAKGLLSGRGVARCVVGPDGGMTACAPDAANPEGFGFSEAAVKLASTMKMNLWSADARPVEGGTVRVAIRINLKGAGSGGQ